MPGKVTIVVLDRGVSEMFLVAPKFINREMNAGLQQVSKAFYTEFGQKYLSGRPGVEIHRGERTKGKGSRSRFVTRRARAAGFYGVIYRSKQMHGKTLAMGTRSVAMITHEYGARITPKKGKYLYVKVRTPAGAAAARAKVGSTILVRKVHVPKRLRFRASWRMFVPKALKFLDARMSYAVAKAAMV